MSRRLLCGARRLARATAALAITAVLLPGSAAAAVSPRPERGSLEYRLSWGVDAIRADPAYKQGADGRGVTVAMIDTGIDPASRSLFAHLSPDSIDLVPGRRADGGDRRHGRQTASLVAGALDGQGTFGIAYEATLLSIRADRDGSCLRTCAFDPQVLASAIDYAVDHGARVIGMPFGANHPIPGIEAALERAVRSGAVIVAAAGNDGSADPAWPGRYASDPRFAPAMIVAGASTPRGDLARFSNRAGATSDRYVAAPGDRVIVDCIGSGCTLTSGTSFSVAYVAGAVALLLSRYPALAGRQAADAVLGSARDLEARGTDPLAGRGLVDIRRALQSAAASLPRRHEA